MLGNKWCPFSNIQVWFKSFHSIIGLQFDEPIRMDSASEWTNSLNPGPLSSGSMIELLPFGSFPEDHRSKGIADAAWLDYLEILFGLFECDSHDSLSNRSIDSDPLVHQPIGWDSLIWIHDGSAMGIKHFECQGAPIKRRFRWIRLSDLMFRNFTRSVNLYIISTMR